MLDGKLADIYIALWHLSDDRTPPVRVSYEFSMFKGAPAPDAGALFLTGQVIGGKQKDVPGIWIKRNPVPSPRNQPDLDNASAEELISLAHERGHESSWRAGTYEPTTMAEEHRAWAHAEQLLRDLGFDLWLQFEEAKQHSLDEHIKHGTPA